MARHGDNDHLLYPLHTHVVETTTTTMTDGQVNKNITVENIKQIKEKRIEKKLTSLKRRGSIYI
jgi:hypothetical protein